MLITQGDTRLVQQDQMLNRVWSIASSKMLLDYKPHQSQPTVVLEVAMTTRTVDEWRASLASLLNCLYMESRTGSTVQVTVMLHKVPLIANFLSCFLLRLSVVQRLEVRFPCGRS